VVMGQALAAEEGEATGGAHGGGDVGEGGGAVVGEQGAEPAGGDVERSALEGMGLGVGLDELDVGGAPGGGALTGQVEHASGEVDAENRPLGGAGGEVEGRLAGAAADVQHPVGGLNDDGVEEPLP